MYRGVFMFAGGLGVGGGVVGMGGAQIFYVNVYRVAPSPGGRGYYKSPPFIVQYSWPHVFQCSEVFLN